MNKTHSITRIATAVVSGWRFINAVGTHAASSLDAIGISEQGAPVGKAFSAVTNYSCWVEAAEAIAENDLVKPATDGTGRAAKGTAGDSCGRALSTAAAGKLVEVRFLEGVGAVSPPGRSRTLKKYLWGRLATAAQATDQTSHYQVELEAPWLSFRLWVPNLDAAPVAGLKLAAWNQSVAGNYDSGGAPLDQSAGVVAVTFGGAATATLPARIAAERASWTPSDWIMNPSIDRTDGGLRPLLGIRVEKPAAVGTATVAYSPASYWTGPGASTVAGDDRLYRKYFQAVLGVTTPGAFTSQVFTGASGPWPVMIEYVLRDGYGTQWIGSGDSIVGGLSASVGNYGYWQRVALRSSTPAAPIDYFNAGLHAQVPSVYVAALEDVYSMVKPDVLLYCPFSINQVPGGTSVTQAVINSAWSHLGRALELADSNSAKTILTTALPCSTGFKVINQDSNRRQFNVDLMTRFASQTRVAVADVSAVYSGAVDGNGQTNIVPAFTADAVHPNTPGHDALMAPVQAALAALG